MVDLSVVVVSYNTRDLLRGCLDSVFGEGGSEGRSSPSPSSTFHLPPCTEVFVVDNASTDGTADLVASAYPQVQLIRNEANRGFAAASNQALRQSRGRYVVLLNPDTVVLDDALGRLVEFMDAHPRAGAAGPQLLNPDGTFQHGCFRFPNLWMTFFDFFPLNHRLANSRLNGRYPASAYSGPFAIDHPLGACLLVRREALEQVGLLDEGFFMYCEEIDWCLRLKRVGWQIYCVPEARVIHYGGQSTRQVRQAMFVELHRSRYRLFRKHYSPLFYWSARALVAVGVLWEGAGRWRQHRRGELDRASWKAWRRAYREVGFGPGPRPQ